jgi:hypothetical protein
MGNGVAVANPVSSDTTVGNNTGEGVGVTEIPGESVPHATTSPMRRAARSR